MIGQPRTVHSFYIQRSEIDRGRFSSEPEWAADDEPTSDDDEPVTRAPHPSSPGSHV